jgi:transposase
MRMESFLRRARGLKGHRVVRIEEDAMAKQVVIHVARREHRRLLCGECGLPAGQVARTRRPPRRWRDLALREHIVELVYAPCRVRCPRCGLRVERVPWAGKWQRVTHAVARAVAALARELTWSAVAHHFRLNWKTIAAVVEGVVLWGLQHRRWEPLHVIGIDEVSRRKGHQYLTIVYDLGRGGSCGSVATAPRRPWSGSSYGWGLAERAPSTPCAAICGASTSTPSRPTCRRPRWSSIASTSASI